MSIEQSHCLHDVNELHRRCCHCGQDQTAHYLRVDTPDSEFHGAFDPSGHDKVVWTELSPCIPWSWRVFGGEPCDNCDDTGTVHYMTEGCMGEDYASSYKCGCREFFPHPFQENGSLDKCRRCQLPGAHGMHG